MTIYGHSAGATHILALMTSPLAKGLFHKAWMASGSPRYDKLAKDAYNDNLVYLKNTNCSTLDCLLGLSSQQATEAIPWDTFPNWNMYDQYDLPYKLTQFDGSMAIVDGKLTNESANQLKYSISWSCYKMNWATSWENLFMPYANIKGADQPAHPRSLISAFVVCRLHSIIPLVSISDISNVYLASVAAQASLSLTWSQTPKTGFLVTRLNCEHQERLYGKVTSYTLTTVSNEPAHEIMAWDYGIFRPSYSFFKRACAAIQWG